MRYAKRSLRRKGGYERRFGVNGLFPRPEVRHENPGFPICRPVSTGLGFKSAHLKSNSKLFRTVLNVVADILASVKSVEHFATGEH
jgi:hypothetical protein